MKRATPKPQLLFIGNEPMLSKASAELLKRVGYRVRTTNPVNAVHTIREAPFAAVILCATLSSDEAAQIVEQLAEAGSPTPVVSVHLGLLGDAPHPGSSVVVDALNGPDALVRAVETVARVQPRAFPKAV